ncbi:single-stranded DNA-binding protein [Microbacterium sp. NPDC057407]|uniref:single-stranded DNA-binding protein n=1 Tax=Microbacterium sp. NPDC057407 TaxID=3346120 RepID=UPI00366D6815
MGDTITVTGNVATDPEHKRTHAGLAITTFRLASGQRRFDRTSNAWVETGTNWYSVSAFRNLAEHAHASLRRGDRVVLTGRLRVRDWDNGTTRGRSIEIDADAIGHDLRWGTTTFTKSARGQSPDREEPLAPHEEGESDEWATPGMSGGERSDWSDTGGSATPHELVPAGPPF